MNKLGKDDEQGIHSFASGTSALKNENMKEMIRLNKALKKENINSSQMRNSQMNANTDTKKIFWSTCYSISVTSVPIGDRKEIEVTSIDIQVVQSPKDSRINKSWYVTFISHWITKRGHYSIS